MTGSEALTIGQAAQILSDATGRAIRCVDVPEAAARQAMLDFKMPPAFVDGLIELHAIDKAGSAAVITPTVQELLGRPPKTFEEFVREHAARWRV